MSNPSIEPNNQVIDFQERRLGHTVIKTYRAQVDIDELVLDEHQQPRVTLEDDAELQRQIEASKGILEPLLVEPHPDQPNKFRIIDGGRRWKNSKILVDQGKDHYRKLPVDITDRTLSDEERLRVWVHIHRQRSEREAKEREMVAFRLDEIAGRASAASILDITVRELDKRIAVYKAALKFTGLYEPGAAITWARELMGVSKKLLTPTVMDAVIDKVNNKRITNSKDLRSLRKILRDPVAKDNFLKPDGDIETALLRVAPPAKKSTGLAAELEAIVSAVSNISWSALEEMKGNEDLMRKIEEAEAILSSLKTTLST